MDNIAPKFDKDVYYDREKINSDARNVRLNYKNNLEVARKMNKIFRMGVSQ